MKVTFVMRPDGNLFRGGAELMIENTKSELEKFGVQVEILTPLTRKLGDIVHFFGSYDSHWSTASVAAGKGIPYVCSPIFSTTESDAGMRMKAVRHRLTRRYARLQGKLLNGTSAIVVQTKREMRRVAAYFGEAENKFQIVPHGVEERFANASSDLFRSEHGVKVPFVISTGAFSETKNQLGLIKAMKGTGIHLLFAGNVMDSAYLQACRTEAGEDATFIEGIPYESDLLPSAYAAAQAFSLPSLNETFCMAAMEAAVAGCPVVLGNGWEAEEIYGDYAQYVDPRSLTAIQQATLAAFKRGKQGPAQSKHFLQNYRWDAVTKKLLAVYEGILDNPSASN